MPEPWERLVGEGQKRWEAFGVYRDMGAERSLAKVARQLGKSKQLIERWSAEDSWVARCDAWDVETDRMHRQFLVAHRREVERRQLRIAGAMQARIVDRLSSLKVEELSPRDLATWFEVTLKVQRSALGMGEKLELTGADGGPIELANLTAEQQAARLAEIGREIRRRLEETGQTAPEHDLALDDDLEDELEGL